MIKFDQSVKLFQSVRIKRKLIYRNQNQSYQLFSLLFSPSQIFNLNLNYKNFNGHFHKMNRLSILNGNLPTDPKQNIKQAAYIEYLKSFAQNGLQTLEKLQNQFNKHFSRQKISEDLKIFHKINTLISSYEVFILEINDSCEFIQVPEFGTCILRTFIQLLGILKWSFQHLVSHKKVQGIVAHAMQQNKASHQMSQTFNPSINRRESHMMRNTFNGNVNSLSKQGRCSQCSNKIDQPSNNIYKIKQTATMQLKDINEEILRITKEYTQEQKQVKKQQMERKTLQKYILKRQQEGKGYLNIGLGQKSKNQEILTEILYTLNRKGEAIGRFADLRISSLNETSRAQQSNEQEYQTLKTELASELSQKVQQAKHKLSSIFKQHIIQYQKQKLLQLVDTGVQIQDTQSIKLHKNHQQKVIKNLKSQLKKQQKQLDYERNVNEGMRNLLKQKSIEYEGEVMRYRNQLINIQFKSRKDILKSSRKVKVQKNGDYTQQKRKKLRYADSFDENRSIVSIDINQIDDTKNIKYIKYDEDSDDSYDPRISKFVNTKGFLQTGKRLSKTKNVIKFEHIIQKSYLLDLHSSVINFHQILLLNEDQNSSLKLKKISQNNDKVDIQVQTSDKSFKQYLTTLSQAKSFVRTQKGKNMSTASKNHNLSSSKNRMNIISYKKKRSSHMGDMCQYFQIEKNTQNGPQNANLSNFSRLLSKNTKLLQRRIVSNQINEDKNMKNDFIPLILQGDFKDIANYKRNTSKTRQQGLRVKHQQSTPPLYTKKIIKQTAMSCLDSEQLILNVYLTFQNALTHQIVAIDQIKHWSNDQTQKIQLQTSQHFKKPQAIFSSHARNKLSLTDFSNNMTKRSLRNSSNLINSTDNQRNGNQFCSINKRKLRIIGQMFKKLQSLKISNPTQYSKMINLLFLPHLHRLNIIKFLDQGSKHRQQQLRHEQMQKDVTRKLALSSLRYSDLMDTFGRIQELHRNCVIQKQNNSEGSTSEYCMHLRVFLQILGIRS